MRKCYLAVLALTFAVSGCEGYQNATADAAATRQAESLAAGFVEGSAAPAARLASSVNSCAALIYVGSDNAFAVMRATRPVTVTITHTRNGRYTGSINVFMREGDTVNLLRNDGRSANFDGFSC